MYDIIVIGAGPAGLTAAIYAKRAGKKVLLLEANKIGGAINKAHVPCIKWHQLIFTIFTAVFRGNSKLVLFPRF